MKVSKWILAVGLAVMLIGIAYVQAIFSHQDRDQAPELLTEQPEMPNPVEDYISRDDHAQVVDSIRRGYVDSLAVLESILAVETTDVSGEEADSLGRVISELINKLAEADNTIAELKRDNSKQSDELVYSFYSKELAALPADLSEYERNVSIKEIKGKVTRYFGVSSTALNKIVKKYKK